MNREVSKIRESDKQGSDFPDHDSQVPGATYKGMVV